MARQLKKHLLVALLVLSVLVAGTCVLAVHYLGSAEFQELVRRRVVATLENETGGRVDVRSLTWNLRLLEVDIRGLTIHGTEASGEVPYLHVEHAQVGVKVLALAWTGIHLRYVSIDQPVFHLIVYPDGGTNQPTPKALLGSHTSATQQFLDLAIGKLEVHGGQLLLNDRIFPLEFAGSDVQAQMNYLFTPERYEGHVAVGKIDTRIRDWHPLVAGADLQFALARDKVEVKLLRVRADRTELEVQGTLTSFRQPKAELTWSSTLDLKQLADSARVAELRAGVLQLSGKGSFTQGEMAAAGKVQVKDLSWNEEGLRLQKVDGGAEYTLSNSRIALTHLFARVLEGTITGDADVRNWMRAEAAKPANGKKRAPPPSALAGSARLKIEGVQLRAAASALATQDLPLDQFKMTGSTSGQLAIVISNSWHRPTYNFNLISRATASAAADELPVDAQASGSYAAGMRRLEINRLDLSTRVTRVQASGALGPGNEKLAVHLTATELSELEQVIAALGGPQQLPARLSGTGSFEGDVRGRIEAPTIRGHIELADFALWVPEKAGGDGASHHAYETRWDRLSTDVQVSAEQLTLSDGLLVRQLAQVVFNGGASLHGWRASPDSALRLQTTVRGASLNDLQSLFRAHYPLEGIVNMNLQVSGTGRDLSGDGSVHITQVKVYGELLGTVTADLLFAHQEGQLRGVSVSGPDGHLQGEASCNWSTRAFQFQLQGNGIDLARIKRFQGARLALAGVGDLAAQGSGTLDEPSVNAQFHLRGLRMNDEEVGEVEGQATTGGEVMTINARSHFQTAEFALDGKIRLRGDYPVDATLVFARVDMEPLLRAYLRGEVAGRSQASGSMRIEGTLRDWRHLKLTAEVQQFSAEVGKVKVRSDGVMKVAVTDGVLQLNDFRLLGEDTELTASGTAQLGGQRDLNLQAEGHINLKLLQTINPTLRSAGKVNLAIRASGTLDNPVLEGRADLVNGELASINFPNGLSGLNGRLVFDQDRMRIRSLTGHTGGGNIELSGFVTYSSGISFDLTAHVEQTRLRYPEGISSVEDADLRFVGTPQSSTLSGEVTVTRLGLSPEFDLAVYLGRGRSIAEIPNPNSVLNNLRLDVHVSSAPELQVQSTLGRVSGTVDLRLRGTVLRPMVLGRVSLLEGQVKLAGQRYNLEHGDVVFTNPVRINPTLDLVATTRISDYDISLGFHGTLDKLNTTYISDPPLPTADIINLLAFGTTRQQTTVATQYNTNLTESMSSAVLGQALDQVVSNRVERLFGVSRIKIAPDLSGVDTNPGTKVTIEQQVSNKFTVTYVTNLSQTQEQLIQVEYNVNSHVSLVALRDQYGVVSVDVKYRHRRK